MTQKRTSKTNPKDYSTPERVLTSAQEILKKDDYKDCSMSEVLKAIEISVIYNLTYNL